MEGYLIAGGLACLIVIATGIASLLIARELQDLSATGQRLEIMLAELPAKIAEHEHVAPLEAAERLHRLDGAKDGRSRLIARAQARGWTYKPPKGFK
jgi:hypothetical protein